MGTRGHLGGVAEATLLAGVIVDASGRDVLLYETVGVGQSEVEVAGLADTVALVLMPGSGDSIQALKAGVMEIPDIIVVNKADHPSIERTRAELEQVLSLADRERRPVVLETVATDCDRHRGAVGGRRGAPGARSRPPAISPSAARRSCARSCSRSPRRARRAGWARPSTAAPTSPGSSTRSPSARSTR